MPLVEFHAMNLQKRTQPSVPLLVQTIFLSTPVSCRGTVQRKKPIQETAGNAIFSLAPSDLPTAAEVQQNLPQRRAEGSLPVGDGGNPA